MPSTSIKHISLSKLNEEIHKRVMRIPSFWVVAEISSIKLDRKGNAYLDLVETNQQQLRIAQARATIWQKEFAVIHHEFQETTGRSLSEGLKILFHATVRFHAQYGLSLSIDDIHASFTLGEIHKEKAWVIQQLKEKGEYPLNKQKVLTEVPQRIAVISSKEAQGYYDFMSQIEHSGFHFDCQLFAAEVQGKHAGQALRKQLIGVWKAMQEGETFDAVVMIRGGGSKTDLSAFDELMVAQAVARFPIPVLSGIGHTNDLSVVDEVSFQNCDTPTGVAKFLIDRALQFQTTIEHLFESILVQSKNLLTTEKQNTKQLPNKIRALTDLFTNKEANQLHQLRYRLDQQAHHFIVNETAWLVHSKQMLSNTTQLTAKSRVDLAFLIKQVQSSTKQTLQQGGFETNKLKASLKSQLQIQSTLLTAEQRRLADISRDIRKNIVQITLQEKQTLSFFQQKLQYLDPKHLLKKGFVMVEQDGKIIKSSDDIVIGKEITSIFADGKVSSKVIKKT
ncbi:exodeoxyribonuclease VII large subunit [Algivirga pacifica]|uniref:Exodeoxyribonuclease 7 large subunit n=1 Tax=Algivirga pacifica TaxID=1162670 RepID=A0ABP9DJG7_9BACT